MILVFSESEEFLFSHVYSDTCVVTVFGIFVSKGQCFLLLLKMACFDQHQDSVTVAEYFM